MAVVLAGSGSVQGIPQHQRVLGAWMHAVGGLQPLLGQAQQVCKLIEAEVQGLVVLEEGQAMAGLAGLEQVGGRHSMAGLQPASSSDASQQLVRDR